MHNTQAELADQEAPHAEAEQAELSTSVQPEPAVESLPTLQTRVRMFDPKVHMFDPVMGTARDENGEVQDARYWAGQELAIDLKNCREDLSREAYLEFRGQVLAIIINVTTELYGIDKVLEVKVAHIQDHLDEAGGPRNNGLGSNVCITITWWPSEGTLETNSRQHEEKHLALILQAVLSLYQLHLADHPTLQLVKG